MKKHDTYTMNRTPVLTSSNRENDASAPVDRLEHLETSLELLESLQESFRRGRLALAPYLESATAAYERLEESDDFETESDETRQRLLETCEAFERLMRVWAKSRDAWSSRVRNKPSADIVSAS